MTEHEYIRLCEIQQSQMEHRREVCAQCEYDVTTPDNENEHWCACPNDTGYCFDLSELMSAEDGFCDAWGEHSDNAPTLTPKAEQELFKRMYKAYKEHKDAEVARNVAKVKGFCVRDINKYVACVNSFCERIKFTYNDTKFFDKDITRGMYNEACRLIAMSKGEENGSTKEEH